jgi:MFS transporter, BCD family, chlorophyll transporter
MNDRTIGWFGIVRLGLVQAALGGIVVLTTSTMNRVMVVELALPAILPGVLVAWHYCVQLLRPRLGHGSDVGGRRSPWIIGGMATLATGGIAAGVAIAWMKASLIAGVMLAIAAFTMIGIGVGAAGTSLLVLLAKSVAPNRRAAAATIVWVMMIAGFAVTAGIAGHFLNPFSLARLIKVISVAGVIAVLLTIVAVWRIEIGAAPGKAATPSVQPADRAGFREALTQVWAEPQTRRFAIFVFISMVAYSAQELVLEPFAGAVFGLTPGQSATLTSFQHSGALLGMLVVAILGSVVGFARQGSMRSWTIGGCVASAAALLGLAVASFVGPGLASARLGFCARSIERDVCRFRHRGNDGPRSEWSAVARRRPHGSLGCGPSDRICGRRSDRYRFERHCPTSLGFARRRLCDGICRRGGAFPAGRPSGRQGVHGRRGGSRNWGFG